MLCVCWDIFEPKSFDWYREGSSGVEHPAESYSACQRHGKREETNDERGNRSQDRQTDRLERKVKVKRDERTTIPTHPP